MIGVSEDSTYCFPNFCNCSCHMVGIAIMHCVPCCDFTYKKYSQSEWNALAQFDLALANINRFRPKNSNELESLSLMKRLERFKLQKAKLLVNEK